MTTPAQNAVLLELHIPDFELAKKFYGELGFQVAWERMPEEDKGYLVLKRSDNILCFWPGNKNVYEHDYFQKFPKDTKRGYGVEIVIMIEDIDRFYEATRTKAKVVEELQVRPWGLRDFRIEDPFGYYLRFTEPHNILDDDNAVG